MKAIIPRKHPRFPVNLSVYFARDHRRRADLLNMSLGGCCMQNVAPEVGMAGILTLFVALPGSDQPLRVDAAQVRWAAGPAFGIRFLFLERREQQRLEQHIVSLAAHPIQAVPPSTDASTTDGVDDFNARVTKKAYELFLRRGQGEGGELEDWLEAERLVREEMRQVWPSTGERAMKSL
jgi:hypothetical protein